MPPGQLRVVCLPKASDASRYLTAGSMSGGECYPSCVILVDYWGEGVRSCGGEGV